MDPAEGRATQNVLGEQRAVGDLVRHPPADMRMPQPLQGLQTLQGLWHSHIGWGMTDKVTNCTLFAKDILRGPTLGWIHRLYVPIVLLGLLLPAVIGGVLSGTWTGALGGFLWGGRGRVFP